MITGLAFLEFYGDWHLSWLVLWGFFLSDASKYILNFDKIMVPMVIIVAVFLLWFAGLMTRKGILN